VDRRKIEDYLLCRSHPDGWGKADFFERFGFTVERWKILAEALRRHGQAYNVTNKVESAFGVRYSVDGLLETPDGRNPMVRTVWIIERGAVIPRLITAHPLEG
jgi:hypothetical protein